MAVGYGVPVPKPEKRKRVKGRKLRAESKVKQSIRAQCVERDGDCRVLKSAPTIEIAFEVFGECRGESEWAHMHAKRRSQTRG